MSDLLLPSGEPELPEDVPMTIWEHLRELRKRLVLSLLGMIPGVTLAGIYHRELLALLAAPLEKAWLKLGLGAETPLNSPHVVSAFAAYMRISVVAGIIVACPWIAYQAWSFIAPGLYSREKAYAIPFAFASAVFFIGGAWFGWAFVFPVGFEALLDMGGPLPGSTVKIVPTLMIEDYLAFVTQMLLGFGLVFEVPVVVCFLSVAGLVNWKQLLKFGRWWVALSSVIAAVLTPSPDVGSQLMMMAPMVVLYFAAVGVAYLIGPKPEAEPAEDTDDSGPAAPEGG